MLYSWSGNFSIFLSGPLHGLVNCFYFVSPWVYKRRNVYSKQCFCCANIVVSTPLLWHLLLTCLRGGAFHPHLKTGGGWGFTTELPAPADPFTTTWVFLKNCLLTVFLMTGFPKWEVTGLDMKTDFRLPAQASIATNSEKVMVTSIVDKHLCQPSSGKLLFQRHTCP